MVRPVESIQGTIYMLERLVLLLLHPLQLLRLLSDKALVCPNPAESGVVSENYVSACHQRH